MFDVKYHTWDEYSELVDFLNLFHIQQNIRRHNIRQ